MDILLQQIINGLVLGSVYALVALGYTMVYGIIQLINFAHGEVLMVGRSPPGRWLGFCNLPCLACRVGHFNCCGSVRLHGFGGAELFHRKIAYRPLRNSPRLAPLITAIGMSILLQTLAMIIWKPNPKAFPTLLPSEPYNVLGAVISPTDLLILGLTAAFDCAHVAGAHHLLGRAMRATAENHVAALMGVAGCGDFRDLCHRRGAGSDCRHHVGHEVRHGATRHGFCPGSKPSPRQCLAAGQPAGAVVGGILLGLIEALGSGYIGALTGGVLGSHYSEIFAFIVLIVILTMRPSGLLGERSRPSLSRSEHHDETKSALAGHCLRAAGSAPVLQQFGNSWRASPTPPCCTCGLAIGLNIVVGYAGLLDLGLCRLCGGLYVGRLPPRRTWTDTFS